MIKYNVPAITGKELEYISEVFRGGKFSGNQKFSKLCASTLKERFDSFALVTPSCTDALEMAALLADFSEGDEVIMSPFVFTSTANAFALRGARIVFVDIRPDTMNIDESLIETAITGRTKAIMAMHYAGVACEMDKIMKVAGEHNIFVIEDAAQAIQSSYKGKPCGTFGQFGCFSFHETKNIQCGEGGAILVNDGRYIERAEVIQEKGTDRARFFRGLIDKYTWVDLGSSYLLGELNSAFLFAQLEMMDEITKDRLRNWLIYYDLLSPLAQKGLIGLPTVPAGCSHNGHIFYIKAKDLKERSDLISFLKSRGIIAVFHYVPLHTSPAGKRCGRFVGEEIWVTKESERLLRLPLYYKIREEDVAATVKALFDFYGFK